MDKDSWLLEGAMLRAAYYHNPIDLALLSDYFGRLVTKVDIDEEDNVVVYFPTGSTYSRRIFDK